MWLKQKRFDDMQMPGEAQLSVKTLLCTRQVEDEFTEESILLPFLRI